eukprot:jgi/Mesvir1/8187/Mv12484-RA.1
MATAEEQTNKMAAAADPSASHEMEDCDRSASWKVVAGVTVLVTIASWAVMHSIFSASIFAPTHRASPPTCRKSPIIGIRGFLPNYGIAPAWATGGRRATPGATPLAVHERPTLAIWSGKGQHNALLSDFHTFDLETGTWKAHPDFGEHSPIPRWKSTQVAVNGGEAILVFGGDGSPDDTCLLDCLYMNDTWLFDLERNSWEKLPDHEYGPQPRRAHSASLLHRSGSQSMLIIYGGRNVYDEILGDIWAFHIRDRRWECLTTTHAPDSDGGSSDGGDSKAASSYGLSGLPQGGSPFPRKGHTSVVASLDGRDYLVVYGGRGLGTENSVYSNHVWAFSLQDRVWENWTPPNVTNAVREPSSAVSSAGNATLLSSSSSVTADADDVAGGDVDSDGGLLAARTEPEPRDHHGAMVINDGQEMLVYGGRGGLEHAFSRPLGDLWSFHFRERRWTRLHTTGPKPYDRFLFGMVAYIARGPSRGGDRDDDDEVPVVPDERVVVYAGETHSSALEAAEDEDEEGTPADLMVGCYLSDVWELRLRDMKWVELSRNHFCRKSCVLSQPGESAMAA